MLNDQLTPFLRENYECHEWKHASAILSQDFASEWNKKDPFFDRDLNNFRLLFDLRAVSVGIIVKGLLSGIWVTFRFCTNCALPN